MKVKLLVVSLLVALMAPWGGIGFADAPHRMACCPAGRTEPMVRPCCAMDAQPGTVMIPGAAATIAPLQALESFVPLQETRRLRGDARRAHTNHPIDIRLLTSVFQI